jgi:hypothetical protein
MIAAENGHNATVVRLQRKGADPHAKDNVSGCNICWLVVLLVVLTLDTM